MSEATIRWLRRPAPLRYVYGCDTCSKKITLYVDPDLLDGPWHMCWVPDKSKSNLVGAKKKVVKKMVCS